MQAELDQQGLTITIFGVNSIGHESGVATATSGRTLGLLQDTEAAGVEAAWSPTYRDVIVLNAANEVVAVYNLTDHDLSDATHYAELRELLTAESQATEP